MDFVERSIDVNDGARSARDDRSCTTIDRSSNEEIGEGIFKALQARAAKSGA